MEHELDNAIRTFIHKRLGTVKNIEILEREWTNCGGFAASGTYVETATGIAGKKSWQLAFQISDGERIFATEYLPWMEQPI